MRVVGFIVEYNPFHNGHLWHLKEARRLSNNDYSIAIMSGNFVQRGEPALFDKWTRAEMAVEAGVDLVLELPYVYAVRSAQHFATGAIRLLQALGVVDHICFGAEHADKNLLYKAAEALDQENVQNDIRLALKNGTNYAASISSTLEQNISLPQEILTSPNNILAIEYLRAIKKYAPRLKPIVIKRRAANYNDKVINGTIASATAIRHTIINENALTQEVSMAVPPSTLLTMKEAIRRGQGPVIFENFSTILLAKLRTASAEELLELPDIGEGLHYTLQAAAIKATSVDELITLLKSKRYTWTRLQRILIHALLGTNKHIISQFDHSGPLYARVLAFNSKGRILLKTLNSTASIPVITKTASFLNSKSRTFSHLTPLQSMLAFDTLATDIYVLGIPNKRYHAAGWDFRLSPLYIK